eukprot:356539-Chlamydomonas_euryale.AAC.5
MVTVLGGSDTKGNTAVAHGGKKSAWTDLTRSCMMKHLQRDAFIKRAGACGIVADIPRLPPPACGCCRSCLATICQCLGTSRPKMARLRRAKLHAFTATANGATVANLLACTAAGGERCHHSP